MHHRRAVVVKSTADDRDTLPGFTKPPAQMKEKRRRTSKSNFFVLLRVVLLVSALLGFCTFLLSDPKKIATIRTSLGLRATAPIKVEGAVVRRHNLAAARYHNHISDESELKTYRNESMPIRLMAFDEGFKAAHARLSREWDLIRTEDDNLSTGTLNVSHVRSNNTNVCVGGRSSSSHNFLRKLTLADNSIRCVPSFFVVGFEKCSTTALSIWLSHHPNLQSRWMEGRFFDHVQTVEDLEEKWYSQYLMKTVPRIPSGSLGQYWTFEKSPAYASSPRAPEMLSRLIPAARLLFMTRNPTRRAYSMFLMYTSHYRGVGDAVRRQPLCFFVKNADTGDVRYVGDRAINFDIGPGVGGQRVPSERLPSRNENEEWRFLSFPPNPKDFHKWIEYALGRAKEHKPNFSDHSRPHRILFGGFYASYLKRWLQYFPAESFVLLPSELFYTDQTAASLTKLQGSLGLPLYDYHSIGKIEANFGRFDIKSPAAWLNGMVNSYHRVPPILDETKLLLDDFYCKENRDLSLMLGGRNLLGYACAESIEANSSAVT